MTSIKRDFAIPLLPTHSIDATLEFYKALGFEVTYHQKRPNTYAAIKRETIELHFFVMKDFEAKNNYSTCYLIIHDIDPVYYSFTAGLKNLYGKLPMKGIPRINLLKDIPAYGVRQFIVVDPSGNYIRMGQPIEKTDSVVYKDNNSDGALKKGSAFEVAYEWGSRLADGKDDLEAASKILDKAITTGEITDLDQLFKIIVLRTDIALRMTDLPTADAFLLRGENIIKEISKKELKDEIRLFEELKVLRENE